MTAAIFDEREALQKLIDAAVEANRILPSDAVRADLMSHLPKFGIYQGRFVELETGIAASIAMDAIIAARPHIWPREFRDDDEAAFGSAPTLKARGEYLKTHGPEAYAQALHDWGCSNNDLRPGTRPAVGKDLTSKKPDPTKDRRANPWHFDDPEAQAEQIRIIKTLGTKVAAGLAKAAGKTISGQSLRGAS